MPNDNNDKKSKSLGDFNEYINLILLLMFAIVVATILCVKCCSSGNSDTKTDTEMSQPLSGTISDSTLTQ